MTYEYCYPLSNIGGDYIRAIGGTVLCLAPLALGLEVVGAVWLLPLAALLFGIFLVRTILKHMTTVTVSDQWITLKSIRETTVPWEKLTELTLSYFTTWKSGGKGWMQLRLRGAGKTLRVESSLTGFERVAELATAAARANQVVLTATTLSNLESLGVSIFQPEAAA